MSIIGYAAITNLRDGSDYGASFSEARDAAPSSTSETDKSKKKYIDALAALVPAEVLALHTLVVSCATKTENKVITITEPTVLAYAFGLLCVVCVALYVIPRWMSHKLDGWDILRALIPVAAFAGWTMLQPTSVFDLISSLTLAWRTLFAGSLALVLGAGAAALAKIADEKPKN